MLGGQQKEGREEEGDGAVHTHNLLWRGQEVSEHEVLFNSQPAFLLEGEQCSDEDIYLVVAFFCIWICKTWEGKCLISGVFYRFCTALTLSSTSFT